MKKIFAVKRLKMYTLLLCCILTTINQQIDIIKLLNYPVVVAGPQVKQAFQQFKTEEGKTYRTQEEQTYRLMVFADNYQKVKSHNLQQQVSVNGEKLVKKSTTQKLATGNNINSDFNQNDIMTNNNFKNSNINNQMLNNNNNAFKLPISNKIFQQQNSAIKDPSVSLSQQGQSSSQIFSPDSFMNINKFPSMQSQLSTTIQSIKTKANNFILQLNKFADLTDLQFSRIYTMTFPSSDFIIDKIVNGTQINPTTKKLIDKQVQNIVQLSKKNKQALPQQKTKILPQGSPGRLLQSVQKVSVDWTRISGNVRDQGSCGACYAFATADAVAAINAIYYYKKFLELSVKQILDCNTNGLSFGCNGGMMQGSYAYIQKYGLKPEYQYQYSPIQSECPANTVGEHKVLKYRKLPKSCAILIEELKKKPVAVGVAGYRLKFYKEGVFDDCNTYIDHAVLLIGYQTGLGWKGKNSWGQNWGMNGYFWLAEGNKCGICDNAITVVTDLENKKR